MCLGTVAFTTPCCEASLLLPPSTNTTIRGTSKHHRTASSHAPASSPQPAHLPSPAGVNFALFAQHAKDVTLCLYDVDSDCVTEYPLDPGSQRSGDVWHISLEGLPGSNVMYGFKVSGDGGWDTGHRCVHTVAAAAATCCWC
jgi:pullulanase/glycogen debranching enzyme